jgi:hypothetical protein
MLRRRPIARTVARTAVIAGTASVVAGGVQHHQQQKYAAQAQAAAPPPQPEVVYAEAPAPAPVGGMSPEAIEQLKQLAGLKEQGILTEEEFTAQKAKILGA